MAHLPRAATAAAAVMVIAVAVFVTASMPAAATPSGAGARTTHAHRDPSQLPGAWRRVRQLDAHEPVAFNVQIKQCNKDALSQFVLDLSDPNSERWGQHASLETLHAITRCGDAAANTTRELVGWLQSHGADVVVRDYTTFIRVAAPARDASTMLGAEFHEYALCAKADPTCSRPTRVNRAAGAVSLPARFDAVVDFIAGATELIDAEHTKVSNRADWLPAAPGTIRNVTDPFVTPTVLRRLYQVPPNARASHPRNSQGIAAFNDFYVPSDVCTSTALLADMANRFYLPDVTYEGPAFNAAADTGESDLDIQYIIQMGTGAPTVFSNRVDGEWMLDWAQKTVADHSTDTGPWVWSISYGWGELYQCAGSDEQPAIASAACATASIGYHSGKYLDAADHQLQLLSGMGVTVSVSSGDDGAQSFGYGCPIDAQFPIDLSQVTTVDPPPACLFENKQDCRCATQLIKYDDGMGNNTQCLLPLGPLGEQLYGPDFPATACSELQSTPECKTLISELFFVDHAESGYVTNGKAKGSTCNTTMYGVSDDFDDFMVTIPGFISTCTCANLGVFKEVKNETLGTSCSVEGYNPDPAQGGEPIAPLFTPNYPAGSPWVTTIGASQLHILREECAEQDVMADLQKGAEMPCSHFTGGFSGGGGFSSWFARPDWQSEAVEAYLQTDKAPPSWSYSAGNRGYPDISLLGHGFIIVNAGRPAAIGGTSASSPSWAGMLTLLNDFLLAHNHTTLGFMNTLLYTMAKEAPQVFHPLANVNYTTDDTGMTIETGDNSCNRFTCCEYGYKSTDEGWDAVTGLGSPNWAEMRRYIINKRKIVMDVPDITVVVRVSGVKGVAQLDSASSSLAKAFLATFALNVAVAADEVAIASTSQVEGDASAADVTITIKDVDIPNQPHVSASVLTYAQDGTLTRAMRATGARLDASLANAEVSVGPSGSVLPPQEQKEFTSTAMVLLVLLIVAVLVATGAGFYACQKSKELARAQKGPYEELRA